MTESAQILTGTIQTLVKQTRQKKFMLSFRVTAEFYTPSTQDIVTAQPRSVKILVTAETENIGIWTNIVTGEKLNHQLTDTDWKFHAYHPTGWKTEGMCWVHDTFMDVREELFYKVQEQQAQIQLDDLNTYIKCNIDEPFYTPINFGIRNVKLTGNQDYVVEAFEPLAY